MDLIELIGKRNRDNALYDISQSIALSRFRLELKSSQIQRRFYRISFKTFIFSQWPLIFDIIQIITTYKSLSIPIKICKDCW